MRLIETSYQVILATTNDDTVVGHFDLHSNSGSVNQPVKIYFNSFKNWLLSLKLTFKENVEIHVDSDGIIADIITEFGKR